MEIIAVANQKGGVGKTTLVLNFAAGAARQGLRTLILDMDPQSNATLAIMGKVGAGTPSLAHVLVGAVSLQSVIMNTPTVGVSIAPASEELTRADLELTSKIGRELTLKRALTPLADQFDLVLIDTSPYLGLLTMNAFVAARHVLVPVSAEYLPMHGLQLLNEKIHEVSAQMERPIDVLGYVLTLFDRRFAMTTEVLALLQKRFGALLLKSKVRANANLKAAPAFRQDIFEFERKTKKPWKGTEDFMQLTDELLERLQLAHLAGTATQSEGNDLDAKTQTA